MLTSHSHKVCSWHDYIYHNVIDGYGLRGWCPGLRSEVLIVKLLVYNILLFFKNIVVIITT